MPASHESICAIQSETSINLSANSKQWHQNGKTKQKLTARCSLRQSWDLSFFSHCGWRVISSVPLTDFPSFVRKGICGKSQRVVNQPERPNHDLFLWMVLIQYFLSNRLMRPTSSGKHTPQLFFSGSSHALPAMKYSTWNTLYVPLQGMCLTTYISTCNSQIRPRTKDLELLAWGHKLGDIVYLWALGLWAKQWPGINALICLY